MPLIFKGLRRLLCAACVAAFVVQRGSKRRALEPRRRAGDGLRFRRRVRLLVGESQTALAPKGLQRRHRMSFQYICRSIDEPARN